MNDFESNLLKSNGFVSSIPISQLMDDSRLKQIIPKEKGVYIVASNELMHQAFLLHGTGGYFKGKNPNVDIGELENNWVDDSQIFYIGKAGGYKTDGTLLKATLHSRIGELISFGQGKIIGHSGGRYLWQLEFAKELIIYYRVCFGEEDPDKTETKLIGQYKGFYGVRPFANLAK